MTKIDRDALERAIALTLAERDRARVAQVEDMLKNQPRAEVGKFCTLHRQTLVLRPKPWQPVPACEYVSVDDRDGEAGPVMGRTAAARLLQRLLENNLSRYEPDADVLECMLASKPAPVKKEAPAESEGSKVADNPRVH
jgi:hypothetical protein